MNVPKRNNIGPLVSVQGRQEGTVGITKKGDPKTALS